jgi:hypothetical protein
MLLGAFTANSLGSSTSLGVFNSLGGNNSLGVSIAALAGLSPTSADPSLNTLLYELPGFGAVLFRSKCSPFAVMRRDHTEKSGLRTP